MGPYPNIPLSAFGEGKLPKRLRKRLQHRADAAARREYAPQIAGLRDVKGRLRQQMENALAADAAAIQQSGQAIQNVPLRGLHGADRRILAGSLAEMAAANEGALPSLQAQTQAEYRPQILGAQQDVINARIAREQTAASNYNTGLTEARGDVEQYLRSQQADQADHQQNQHENARAFKVALLGASSLYTQIEAKAPDHLPKTDDEWEGFLELVMDEEGVNDRITAQKAVEELRKRLGLANAVGAGGPAEKAGFGLGAIAPYLGSQFAGR